MRHTKTTLDAGTAARLDALLDPGAGLFFQRQLEFIFPENLRAKVPARNFRRFLPIGRSIPAGYTSYTQRMYEALGIADWISNYADDLPATDVAGSEDTLPLKECGASYQYSLEEIEAARVAGLNLPAEKGQAARLAIDQKLNRTAFGGDTAMGLPGLANHPHIPRFVLPDAIDATTLPDPIIDEISNMVNSVVELTQEVARPSRLLMPVAQYSHIASTPRAANSDTTILEFLLRSSPYLTDIQPCHELAATSAANPTNTDLLVAYDPDPRVMRFEISREFTQQPPQERNLTYVINCHARCGGLNVPYPLEVVIGELP